jgi:Flp pilus assembly protein TadD
MSDDARGLQKAAFQHFIAGRLDEAVASYREAVSLDPDLAIAWNGLAMVLERQNDLDGAIAAAERLAALDPDDPLAHTSLSRFYQRKGWIERAENEKAVATRLAMKAGGKK